MKSRRTEKEPKRKNHIRNNRLRLKNPSCSTLVGQTQNHSVANSISGSAKVNNQMKRPPEIMINIAGSDAKEAPKTAKSKLVKFDALGVYKKS